MRLKPILAIFKKDLIDGSKNYHIVLMILTPIILSLLFSNLLNSSKSKTLLPTLGLISSPQQPLIKTIAQKGFGDKIKFFQTKKDLESKILEGDIGFGIILPDIIASAPRNNDFKGITILYPSKYPEFSAKSLKEAFESEIRAQLGLKPAPLPIKVTIERVAGNNGSEVSFSDSMFPMLILMALGMLGFLALPLTFVEEREKGTLNALYLTGIKPTELIIGKSLFSFTISLLTVLAIIVLNNRWQGSMPYFWLFVILGSFMCIFTGLIISMFAKTQASVNAMGTTVFMFFQLVPNLRHSSEMIKSFSHFIPSTFIFSGIKKSLYLDLSKVDITQDLLIVAGTCFLSYLVALLLFKFKKADN